MNEFNIKLADILDIDEVGENDILANFAAWDSLSILSIIAMLDSNYGVNVTANDLKNIQTVGELWRLADKTAK
jgi:acyl carrier protein